MLNKMSLLKKILKENFDAKKIIGDKGIFAKNDKQDDKISEITDQLKKNGYKYSKDENSKREYQYKYTKAGEDTIIINFRFGSIGRKAIWIEGT